MKRRYDADDFEGCYKRGRLYSSAGYEIPLKFEIETYVY